MEWWNTGLWASGSKSLRLGEKMVNWVIGKIHIYKKVQDFYKWITSFENQNSNIPLFHYSIIPCMRQKKHASINRFVLARYLATGQSYNPFWSLWLSNLIYKCKFINLKYVTAQVHGFGLRPSGFDPTSRGSRLESYENWIPGGKDIAAWSSVLAWKSRAN